MKKISRDEAVVAFKRWGEKIKGTPENNLIQPDDKRFDEACADYLFECHEEITNAN
jgi:hypothetical protein